MIYKAISVALPALGSAILLISCGGGKGTGESDQNIMTMRGDSITRYESQDGRLTARIFTPLVEQYDYAAEPYHEYRHGVDMVNYDSLGGISSTFKANYAIFFTKLQLWEAKGDVVVTNGKADRLETNQLFWNQLTERVYSNVDSDFFMGEDVLHGTSFESNEDLSDWQVRNANGGIHIDVEPTRDTTSMTRDSLPAGTVAVPPPGETPEAQPEEEAAVADEVASTAENPETE